MDQVFLTEASCPPFLVINISTDTCYKLVSVKVFNLLTIIEANDQMPLWNLINWQPVRVLTTTLPVFSDAFMVCGIDYLNSI